MIDRNLACAGITDFYRSRSVSRDKHPTELKWHIQIHM